jgi:manganese/zinc/iron transport system substrate-binding protein
MKRVGMSSQLLLLAMVLAALLSGCAVQETVKGRTEDGRLRVVATTGMVADVVQNVGGRRVHVTALMGSGVDPHLYKASEGDVLRLGSAAVVFYSGLHLEAKLGDVLERMGDRVKAVAVTASIDPGTLLADPEYENQYDPHVWFDVSLWLQTAETVQETLIELDPEHEAEYRQNANAYRVELEALHRYVQEQANRISAEKRVLITAHDAFNYFGRAYGFEVRGLQGMSTAAEAGTGDVRGLADFIAQRRIPAIFIESSVPVRNVEAVQAAVGSRGFRVTIGGELFSDAMGAAGTPEGTYVGMVRHNIDTIVEALLAEG